MELSHLIQLISELPENSDLSYVRGESKCVFVKIDKNENRLHAKTPEGKEVSFAESFLKDLADRIEENTPFNTSQILNNKGSNRAVVDSIIANTSEFYWLNKDRSRFTVWIPSKPHQPGELVEWTDMTFIKEHSQISHSLQGQYIDLILYNDIEEKDYTLTDLGMILKKMYESGSKNNSQSACVHLFGLKYQRIIKRYKYNVKEIVNYAGISENYYAEVNKGCKLAELISSNYYNTAFWSPSMQIRQKTKTEYSSIANSSYRPYITAIKSKPFLLLAGISGTGKSRIVRELARACWDSSSEEYKAQKPSNFEMVQVKPNWHDSSELIGYVSRINGERYVVGPFLKFMVKALLNPDVPHFLCLDEMNLAPVEQYFAEYLSVIESRKINEKGEVVTDPIIDYENTEAYKNLIDQLFIGNESERQAYLTEKNGKRLSLPANLIVVGTVNMDETTFSFSRKVLDRAMTIEMNDVDLYGGLKQRYESIGKLSNNDLVGTAVEGVDVYTLNQEVCDKTLNYLKAINDVLEGTPFKIAYRTRNEFLLYVVNNLPYNKDAENNELPQDYVIARALDEITSMKILSRIEGDDSKVSDVFLTNLSDIIEENLSNISSERPLEVSISLSKIKEMRNRLSSGYTSFWS